MSDRKWEDFLSIPGKMLSNHLLYIQGIHKSLLVRGAITDLYLNVQTKGPLFLEIVSVDQSASPITYVRFSHEQPIIDFHEPIIRLKYEAF